MESTQKSSNARPTIVRQVVQDAENERFGTLGEIEHQVVHMLRLRAQMPYLKEQKEWKKEARTRLEVLERAILSQLFRAFCIFFSGWLNIPAPRWCAA